MCVQLSRNRHCRGAQCAPVRYDYERFAQKRSHEKFAQKSDESRLIEVAIFRRVGVPSPTENADMKSKSQ